MFRIWILYAFIVGVTASCRVEHDDVKYLNGYWEISKVEFPDGTEKEYKISEIVDHFEIKDLHGVRRKAKPQFDGKYAPAGNGEKFEVIDDHGKLVLKYATEFDSWTEEIHTLTEEELVVSTEEKTKYYYKKSVPFNIK